MKREIEKAYYSVMLPLSAYRVRTSLRVGNLSSPTEHIVANVSTAIEKLFQFCPGGLANIRSLNFQMITGGPSLPLYIDVGSRNNVVLPQPKGKGAPVKKEKSPIIDELSTLPEGMEVLVQRNGDVRVVDSK
ncbi:unnamed protein product, partial [Gongylonema pulchrum]|uniref:Germane domain-containing protein n=1 Tax=Gongylonema pulchrum TaxID=637853 RepID=A0A183DDB5_9BILA